VVRALPSKRRFGISISEDLAQSLDRLTEALGIDRSSLVEEALREYVHDHLHYLEPHHCQGVMILTGRVEHEELFRIIEENRDIIHSYNHTHVGDVCIEFMIVSGPSERIALLHKRLVEETKCKIRYMPITST